MFIPLGTDRSLKRPTVVTYWLIGLNVLIFVLGAIMERSSPRTHESVQAMLWLDPNSFHWWGLFTYQFLHGGLMHLLGNMIFLYVFGGNVEDRFGRAWFLIFYLLGGAVAGGAHCLFERPVLTVGGVSLLPPVIGASGSIAAVTGAYIVFFPRTMVRVLSLIIIIGTFYLPAWWLILAAIIKDLFMHGFGGDSGVALVAHIGGYAFGIGVSLALLATRILPREDFDLFSLARHAHRRREFRELTSRGASAWRADAARAGADPRSPRHKASEKDAPDARMMEHRARIARLLGEEKIADAASEYLRLLDQTGDAVLGRDAQAAIGNHFYISAQWPHASTTYELFIRRYPADREAPAIKLLLALINTRYLNDPVRAAALLREIDQAPLDEQHRALARTLLEELG